MELQYFLMDLNEKMEDFLKNALTASAEKVRAEGVNVAIEIRSGTVSDEIASFCMETATDLVIMTSHGRKGFWHFLLGSISEQVTRNVPCDVLVVHSRIARTT